MGKLNKSRSRGKRVAKVKEPTETNPVKNTASKKKLRAIKDGRGAKIKKVPMVVATPLPPLNLRKIEYMWPKTAKKATPE